MVVNNGWLGMVRQWQELFHQERYSETAARVDLPDYVKLAEASACAGFRCETVDEVDAAITGALECGRAGRDRRPRRPRGEGLPDGPGRRRLGRHDRPVEWAEDDNAWVEEGV